MMKCGAVVLVFLSCFLTVDASQVGLTSRSSRDLDGLTTLAAAVGDLRSVWTPDVDFCLWPGVVCVNGRVTEIHLNSLYLEGRLPEGSVGQLDHLEVLDVSENRLSASIPRDLPNAKRLRTLDMHLNQLTGEIPSGLVTMPRLQYIDLAHNQIEGRLPKISYPMVGVFNVSDNELSGSIPIFYSHLPRAFFLDNHLCDTPLPPCPKDKDPSAPSSVDPIMVIVVVLIILVLILVVVGAVSLWHQTRSESRVSLTSNTSTPCRSTTTLTAQPISEGSATAVPVSAVLDSPPPSARAATLRDLHLSERIAADTTVPVRPDNPPVTSGTSLAPDPQIPPAPLTSVTSDTSRAAETQIPPTPLTSVTSDTSRAADPQIPPPPLTSADGESVAAARILAPIGNTVGLGKHNEADEEEVVGSINNQNLRWPYFPKKLVPPPAFVRKMKLKEANEMELVPMLHHHRD